MCSRLYLARAPSLAALEAFVMEPVCGGALKGGVLQCLKAKCRELARADSAILAAPTVEFLRFPFDASPQLWVVVKKGYFSDKKLRDKLKQLQLKAVGEVAVSHTVFQACYHFTATARLAPKWNHIKGWLVKGTECLSTGKGQALDLEVGVSSTEVTLTLAVHKLSLSFLKVEDLGVTATVLNHFTANLYSTIRETNIYSNRCLLLPNFTIGYVFSASHRLPQSREFPSYDSLRLHWKKQHGIILPERQDLYYQIFFKANPSTFFTYPACCVFKAHPLACPSKDSDHTASSFIEDLHGRMPSVCGEMIRFSSRPLAPLAELSSASEQRSRDGGAQPSTKPFPEAASIFGVHSRQSKGEVSKKPNYVKAVSSDSGLSFGWFQKDSNQVVPSDAFPPLPLPKNDTALQTNAEGRIVPVFKSTKASCSQSVSHKPTLQAQQKAPAIVPTFKPTAAARTALKKPGDKARAIVHQQPPPAKRLCLESQDRSQPAARPAQKNFPPLGVASRAQPQPQDHPQTVPDLNTSSSLPSFERNLRFSQLPANTTTKSAGAKKAPVVGVEGVATETMSKLLKTKVALLRHWLVENGVKCRSKERKEEVVRMVALHIKQTGKAFSL